MAFKLFLLPLPEGGLLTPREALRWLAEDHRPYASLTAYIGLEETAIEGCVEGTVEQRLAGWFLSEDVQTMVEACAEVIRLDKAQRVKHDAAPGDIDYPDYVEKLGFLATSCDVFPDEAGNPRWAVDALTEELVRRTVQRGAA